MTGNKEKESRGKGSRRDEDNGCRDVVKGGVAALKLWGRDEKKD